MTIKNLTPKAMRCGPRNCPSVHQLEDGRLLIVGRIAEPHEMAGSDIDRGDNEEAVIIDPALLDDVPRGWRDIASAPRGSEDIDDTRDPAYVKPPRILLRFGNEAVAIAYWDWYYAEGGHGYRDGFAWIGPECGEPLNLHYSAAPDGWMPLPPTDREGA